MHKKMNKLISCSFIAVLTILFKGVSASQDKPTTVTRQLEGFKCNLPQHPDNGRWNILNGEGNPGGRVAQNTLLKYVCNPGYKLTPDYPFVVCDSNWNIKTLPKCLKLCPPLFSTPTTTLTCEDYSGNRVSCSEATDGTYLTYECIPFYEALGRKQSLYCSRGSWDFLKPVCQPVCGKKVNNVVTSLVFGGENTGKFEYPWVAAIYVEDEGKLVNNCGGTLINPRTILTAAHCVTNNYGNAISEERVEVGVGKYYNEHSDSRDSHAQYSKAARLIVHEDFKGDIRRYQYDIALIITKKLFTLGPLVQPACYNGIDSINLRVGNVGELAGWGITEEGDVANHLMTLKIPFKETTVCTQELPSDWADKYSLDDKMCAGFFMQNKSVCRGDSGSGLVFRNPEDNRFYVHGIVSISPTPTGGTCNQQDNALFTKVARYYEWLDRKSRMSYAEDCILPPYPKNGKWELENGIERSPGHAVPTKSALIFSCNQGFGLSTANTKFNCEQVSLEPPSCELFCPKPELPAETTMTCLNRQNQIIPCDHATNGFSMTYKCPKRYENLERKIHCSEGAWSQEPECKRKNETESSTSDIKVICTYASWWSYKGVNPENFDPSLCTHIVYDFIGVWSKGDLRVEDEELDLDHKKVGLFRRVTNMKNKNQNLKVLLGVGGSSASNSSLFSRIAADAGKTNKFIESASVFLNEYNFDGLDIDWFHPHKSDKDYIKFLSKIRKEFDKHDWLLTASVRTYIDDAGYDAPKMNKILDWITIKSYDMYGPWSEYTGLHSPLYASSKEYQWEKQRLNMHSAARNWIDAGISKSKVVLSVAFYGRSFTLKSSGKHSIHSPITGKGPGVDDGLLRYYEICSKYGSFTEVWDDEQKGAYKYKGKIWIGYNNENAVRIRGEYIKEKGYLGVNVWPVDGDDVHGTCGIKQTLLKHLHEGLGNKVNLDDN